MFYFPPYVLYGILIYIWKTFCTLRKVDRGWQIYFDCISIILNNTITDSSTASDLIDASCAHPWSFHDSDTTKVHYSTKIIKLK